MSGRVMRGVVGLAAACALQASAASGDAAIQITINPEARVSAEWLGTPPEPIVCGKATDFRVRVVNQASVTGALEMDGVVGASADVALEFPSERLRGVAEEYRILRVTLTAPGPVNISVAFKLHRMSVDTDGRSRVHFLLRCDATSTGPGRAGA